MKKKQQNQLLPELKGLSRMAERVMSTRHSNVFTFTLHDHTDIIDAARGAFEQLELIEDALEVESDGLAFTVVRPSTWTNSDIRWISASDSHTFGWFQTLFDELGVKESFGFLHDDMMLFAGYFVAREKVADSNFHTGRR